MSLGNSDYRLFDWTNYPLAFLNYSHLGAWWQCYPDSGAQSNNGTRNQYN
jgi:hypothetical protein